MSTIITKNSSTASAVPLAGNLVKGELAVNVTDKKLFTKDNSGAVVVIADIGTTTASAAAAASSASAAATSATNASNSATAAASSATSANTAKTAAEAARDQTLAAFDNFDDRYLGTKTTDPTLDNDGNALVAGSLYFNSVAGIMKVYTGSVWVAAYVSAEGFATLAGVETLTNKTITNVILDGSITEDVFTFTGTALNPANGTVQTITLSANTTFTDSLTTGQSMILGIDDGTARTVTWPTITWTTNPAAAPTLPTTGFLWVVLWKVGSTLYGKY